MDWKEHHEMRRQEGRLDIRTLGEAMRPQILRGEAFRLSRDERDHIAGHALDSIKLNAANLSRIEISAPLASGSDYARNIAALSNLLGDIGWERDGVGLRASGIGRYPFWLLGELFPPTQLRPWLEEWQRQDDEALTKAEQSVEIIALEGNRPKNEGLARKRVAGAQTKLGTGAILLARLEKRMASRGD